MSNYETRIDRQIREAQARGDFDNLPGAGKPLADNGTHLDEDWWLKQYLARENVGAEALPTSLRLRKEAEQLMDTLAKLTDEKLACEAIEDLNTRITDARRGLVDGPPLTIGTFDVEATIAAWRERRAA